MGKTAFIFPGQGAQVPGMGKDFYDTFKCSHEVYSLAVELLDLDVTALCFDKNDLLDITKYTQMALLTTELAMMEAVLEKGIRPDVTAGLSLGEYAALVASEKMEIGDALLVVQKRGEYMQEAVPTGGAMAAVLGLNYDVVEDVVKDLSGIVELANYNCPGQIVISGEQAAVESAVEPLKAAGAKRVALLNVSGPFHSSMLKGAGEKLSHVLSEIEFTDSDIPYVANVDASYIEDSKKIKDLLTAQVSSSVRWQQSVENMIKDGVDTFIEIGPGRTLAGFLKRIDKSVRCITINKVEDLEKLGDLVC